MQARAGMIFLLAGDTYSYPQSIAIRHGVTNAHDAGCLVARARDKPHGQHFETHWSGSKVENGGRMHAERLVNDLVQEPPTVRRPSVGLA